MSDRNHWHPREADAKLIEACFSGKASDLRVALCSGADPGRARDARGSTALMLVADAGKPGLVMRLLPRSDPLAADAGGRSALMRAIASQNLSCAELLLPASDPRALDALGRSALDLIDPSDSRWSPLREAIHSAIEQAALQIATPNATERSPSKSL